MTRHLVAALTSAALLLSPSLALASPESDARELSLLREAVANLQARVDALSPAPAPSRVSGATVRAVSALNAIRHPFFGAFGLPLHPATISGGSSAISSAQMIDPYVPVDGTMNVTGAVDISAGLTIDDPFSIETAGTEFLNVAYSSPNGVIAGKSSSGIELRSARVDGAAFTAVTISGAPDYTTAGMKILSIGDNAGTSYAEKAYVGYDGAVVSSLSFSTTATAAGNGVSIANGGMSRGGGGEFQIYKTGAVPFELRDGVEGNVLVHIYDDGTTGSMKITGTKSRGTITLSGGTGTATVNTGAVCVCSNATDTTASGCSVTNTTLTATGTDADVIAYVCF